MPFVVPPLGGMRDGEMAAGIPAKAGTTNRCYGNSGFLVGSQQAIDVEPQFCVVGA